MSLKSNIQNANCFLPKLFKDKERKSTIRIIGDLIYLAVVNRTFPSFYFTRHLYKKDKIHINQYLPNKLLYKISVKLNDKSTTNILSNKLYFNLFYSQFLKEIPEILMYNHNNIFIIDNEIKEINTPEEFESLLYEIVNIKSEGKSVFIKKTYDSYGGKNIFKISQKDFPLDRINLCDLYSTVINSGYLFQETITQHAELNRLNSSCINTIRMDTYSDQEGKVNIISAFLRMSINNLHVDNISSGGCLVGIDLNTGSLKKYGYSSITKTGGKILTSHPITGVSFYKFKLPYFTEIKNLVQKVAGIVPSLRLIGWDIAISDKGPILVEGNNAYDITANDLAYGGYKSNPVFKKVLMELKLLK